MFESVTQMAGADRDEVAMAKLLAGKMYDLLRERNAAIKKYQDVIATSEDPTEVREARRLLKDPYHNQ
jgi:hypothetical protein